MKTICGRCDGSGELTWFARPGDPESADYAPCGTCRGEGLIEVRPRPIPDVDVDAHVDVLDTSEFAPAVVEDDEDRPF